MGSSVRKVRIQGREGDEDRRLSLASQPFSEAVTQVSDGFPFDRRLIEVSSSPGLWPDRLERFLQFEAVAFYECKSNRLGSQPSHLTGSVRTIFVQDVISSLQTSAPEEFHASPESHLRSVQECPASSTPPRAQQAEWGRARQEPCNTGAIRQSSPIGLGAAIGWPDSTQYWQTVDWVQVINICSSSRNSLLHLHFHVHARTSKLAALTGRAVRISGEASAAYFYPPYSTTVSGNSLIAW